MNFNYNLIIIIVSCLVSIAGFSNKAIFDRGAHYPFLEKNKSQYYRLLTSGFLHGDYSHLFVNMFVLYGFGNYVEQQFVYQFGALGGLIYIIFYLVTIVLANLTTHFKYANDYNYRAIGASGATSAVLFSYIYFEPMSMLGVFLIIPMPAIIFGVLYLWYSTWAAKKGRDNIGHEAHFYGAIAGFLITVLLYPGYFSTFFQKIIAFF